MLLAAWSRCGFSVRVMLWSEPTSNDTFLLLLLICLFIFTIQHARKSNENNNNIKKEI